MIARDWLYIDGGMVFDNTREAWIARKFQFNIFRHHLIVFVINPIPRKFYPRNRSFQKLDQYEPHIRFSERPSGLNSFNLEALWFDDQRNVIYCFGGDNDFMTYKNSSDCIQSFTPDDKGGGEWMEILGPVGKKPFPSDIHGVSNGKFTSDTNEAYYLGGNVGERSSPSGMENTYYNFGMLKLNFENLTFTNSSYLELSDPLKPNFGYGGVLLNVPIYGSEGVLLDFGGGRDEFFEGFNRINIFDKNQNKWYYQIADGDLPRPRSHFCAVGVHEKNYTSFEM